MSVSVHPPAGTESAGSAGWDKSVIIPSFDTDSWQTARGVKTRKFIGHDARCWVVGIERQRDDLDVPMPDRAFIAWGTHTTISKQQSE